MNTQITPDVSATSAVIDDAAALIAQAAAQAVIDDAAAEAAEVEAAAVRKAAVEKRNAPFANFPYLYREALLTIQDTLNVKPRIMSHVCDAFEAFAGLKPVKVVLPSGSSREEKFAARDEYKSDVATHQAALKRALRMAEENGAIMSEKYAGSISTAGAVSLRHTVTAKLCQPKRDAVRL
jgi:hypothetical protein